MSEENLDSEVRAEHAPSCSHCHQKPGYCPPTIGLEL